MSDFAQHHSYCKALRMVLSFFLLATSGCKRDECYGPIEGIVLQSRDDINRGGERIYLDIRNKAGIGIHRRVYIFGHGMAEFNNVVIIRDPESRFKGRKKICFDKFSSVTISDYGTLNAEDIPELELY
ncbi:hypothetical protein GCM10023185_32050 [Hymenobacter saemangeumensis]|uniref:Uncharacterized protein n=1 Tax=Hymenobacter saemangeumensis TaxID=1084522 RepID=A0ABP8IMH4_9BACT